MAPDQILQSTVLLGQRWEKRWRQVQGWGLGEGVAYRDAAETTHQALRGSAQLLQRSALCTENAGCLECSVSSFEPESQL